MRWSEMKGKGEFVWLLSVSVPSLSVPLAVPGNAATFSEVLDMPEKIKTKKKTKNKQQTNNNNKTNFGAWTTRRVNLIK